MAVFERARTTALRRRGFSSARASLDRSVNFLGAAAALAYGIMALSSYALTPALWDPAYSPQATAFFKQLYGEQYFDALRAFFGGPLAAVISHFIPLSIASAAAIALIVMIGRRPRRASDRTARLLLRWSFVFAALGFFAYPIFTQDFWLSAVWGKMSASGVNPYYQTFTSETVGALPLDHFPMTMSYGPLWALISGLVMGVAGGSVLAAGLLFKVVLAGAWCGSLILTDRILAAHAPSGRALGLAVAGWLPLGVWQTVAEGHNDVVMVFPALLWLFLLLQKRLAAPAALAASMLCKYTTLPLFLVDFVHCLRARRLGLRDYAARLLVPGIIAVAVTAVFYRSFAFFDGTRLVNNWHFMQPADAYAAADAALGGWLPPLGQAIEMVFPIIAIRQGFLYWREPNNESLLRLTLAAMCAVSFAAISHLWTWYLLWTLLFAALVPGWWLSRFIVGFALLMPFSAIVWWVPEARA
ncbi:MAG: hypothetical protein HC850_01390 [Rhodomicrobium sp.]|nr:hypothetical protein [Rhodomicrobium sp.]